MTTTDASGTLAAWARRHRVALGAAGAVAAAGMTALWCLVVPEKADTTGGVQAWAIRWGHPACWALLSAAGVAHARGWNKARDACGFGALGCYAAFLAALAL